MTGDPEGTGAVICWETLGWRLPRRPELATPKTCPLSRAYRPSPSRSLAWEGKRTLGRTDDSSHEELGAPYPGRIPPETPIQGDSSPQPLSRAMRDLAELARAGRDARIF